MDFLSRINAALGALDYPPQPEGLYEPITYALGMGGKRVRPVLTLLTYSLYREDVERALPAALAVEMYHNHTLLHDDLMDDAAMRRGMPTVYRRWDANTAVLSGDAMLIEAFRLVLGGDYAQASALTRLLADTALEVCEGQQYDMNFERLDDVSVDDYLEMIRLKTSVLLGCAAKMGALVADAPRTDAETLYRFAERIGLAFQLQDDYLDCFGDPAVFGKNIGGDILCGKKTFLLLTALARGNEGQRRDLRALINDKGMAAEKKIEAVLALYRELDVPVYTQAAIERYFEEAHRLYSQLAVEESRKAPLWVFAETLLKRQK